jgi:cytochrome c
MPFGPMGAFGGLTQRDATDIANYIKSLPAISNQIDDMCSFPPGQ